MKLFRFIFIALPLFGIISCSQQKNTIVNRTYHDVTAHYNGFFNGRLALQEAHDDMRNSYQEDYTSRLPLFIEDKDEVVQPIYPKLDRAIAKTSLVIDRHSMDIKGKEYCKWIDETWVVMGEAQFLKREYIQAKQIFDFTKRKYDDDETKQLSLYWLGRIYTAQENYTRAGDHFRKVSVVDGFPEKMLGDLFAAKADFYLKQNRLEDAIEELEKSVIRTKKRAVKTRRMFILAQLLREDGDGIRSSALYEEVIKRNPEYEMAFYAKINRALAHDVTAGNTEEIKEILFKMLRDEKNIEYQDQIYYALAELELKEGNEPKGVEYLKLATQKSVRNGNAKGLAYYRLAGIYFDKPNYAIAQAYYDSTVTFLNTEHPDYDMIMARAGSLTQMMRDIEIVDREDSLQDFALLSEKEQERRIEMLIDDFIQAEKDAERQKQLDQMESQQAKFDQNSNFNQNANRGEWYFYNAGAVGFGASEFLRIWGKRKNEDNWRRADKTTLAPLLLGEEGEGFEEDTLDGANDPKNANYYWKSVPDTDEKLDRSHALIIEALYDLALVYKEQMKDDPKAIETFEELIARYDSSKYHVNVHYQLYLMYAESGNQTKSDYYKTEILKKYPDSEYAKVILNPNYALESVEEEAAVKQLYAQAYMAFEDRNYRQSYDVIQSSLKRFPNSEFTPQFKFLEALCLGFIDSQERMVIELKNVRSSYGNSEVGQEADEIIQYFENGRSLETSLEEAEEEINQEEINELLGTYSYDLGASHNFVMIVPDSSDVNTTQSLVSDFNRKYFSTKGFKTSMIPLKESRAMIIVSNIGYANKALDYYETFTAASPETKPLIELEYPVFVISYDNYAHFYKNQNADAYLQFFNENYLKVE